MRKLFYEDCNLAEFTATVTGCTASDKGFLVTLDATAFYPEGGGQACDLGTLGGVNVLDVQENGEEILHLCDGALEIGATVQGKVDFARRFDFMQQHTGEHIISGLIHEKFGYMNTGFHMGKDVMEVDFDGPICADALAEIEFKANQAIWQDIPLKCWIPDPEELKTVFYRTKRALPWPVRIVQVPGFDSCACCGIHVATTGQVGLIKILSCVSLRGGVRLEMVCGERAYRHMAKIFEENKLVSQAFSAPMEETGESARKMAEALAGEKAKSNALQEKLFAYIAKDYVNRQNVLHFQPGLEPVQVRLLADQIAGACSGFCAVFTDSGSYCLATRSGDLRQLNKEMNASLDGRGGGKPNFQQGSVRASKEQIEAFFARIL
jgi:alanyl-tRNA synthetase